MVQQITMEILPNWDVGAVTDFSYMFSGSGFNRDISEWNIGSGQNFGSMFASSAFSQNLCPWGSVLANDARFSSSFTNTMCPAQADPNLFLVPPSPLCFQCV